MLLAHIAPGVVTHSLREAEIAEAMQVFNLDRGYAINVLTIKYELISLRIHRGFDVLQALGVLDSRVKRMRVTSAMRAAAAAAARGATVDSSSSQPERPEEAEDLHTEKRRRLTKTRCVAMNPTKNTTVANCPGNEENLVRHPKWGGGLGNSDADREAIEEEIADFKRVRTKL